MAEKTTEEKPVKAEEKKATVGTCGFENKQYFSDSGNKMVCVLAKGHTGDHAAPYPEEGADKDVLVGFNDAAGVALGADVLKKLEAAKEIRQAEKKAAEKK